MARYYGQLLVLDGSTAPRLGHAIALAALARACERLGERAQAHLFLHRAEAAALHPADALQLARHALTGSCSAPRPHSQQ